MIFSTQLIYIINQESSNIKGFSDSKNPVQTFCRIFPNHPRYQLRYTRLFSFYPAGRILPKNRGARWMPFPDPARNTLFQRRACGHRRARMLRYAGRSSASALPAARFFPFCAPRRRGCLRFSPCPQACAVQKHPWAVYARIGPGQAANNLFTALQRKHYTRFFSP